MASAHSGRSLRAAIMVAALAFALPAPAWPRPLPEVVADTISANPEVQRDRALLRAADRRVDERFAGFLPKVDLESAGGYEYTNDPFTRSRVDKEPNVDSGRHLLRTDNTLTLRQLVFDGFGTSSRELAAEAERRAAERRVAETSERIAQRAVEVYLDVLRTDEQMALAQANLDYHREILRKVEARATSGLSDQLDLEQARARVALAQASLVLRAGEQRSARARYLEFIGQAPADLLRPPPEQFRSPPTIESAIDEALRRNPTVSVTAAQIDAARAEIDAARATFYPRLDLEVAGTTGTNIDGVIGRDSSVSVMLRLRYTLFNGFFDDATVQRRSAEAAAASYSDGEARRQVREDTRVAFRNLTTAQDRLPPLRDHVASSRRTVDDYLGQFELGKRKLLDLLDAQNEHYQARSNLVDGDYTLLVAQFRLAFAMGQLRGALGIGGD
ncbi:MAG: TolC family outer membrane protein [Alphaproteobacteria bacterium]|nr:TolC family outer membrane protein [Alphaproteobacteria bacterium]